MLSARLRSLSARCSAVSPDDGAGRFVSRFTSFGTCVPSRNSNFSFERSTASSSPSSYWIAWRSPSYDATPPEYQASSAGHQTLRRRPTTSAPGPFVFAGSSGAFVEGFLKKLASVVCFIDPVEDLRPLMVLLRSLRRRAADLVLRRAWRRGCLSRPARGVGSRRLAAAQRRLAGVF